MPELRRGPTTDRWVIVAPERAKRPSDFEKRGSGLEEQDPGDCPFCAGNEKMTPPEIFRISSGDSWHVRVIPNKFPALEAYDGLGREAIEGFYDRMNGVGAHEVVIESPDHTSEIPDLPEEQVNRIVDTYIARLKHLMENPWLRYVFLFKNHGKEAGASLLHPHSQIIATPIIPQEVRNSLNVAKSYYERKERCLYCDVMLAEIRCGERIVEEDDQYVVWAPYDSRFPFELVIYPKAHSHDFTTLDDNRRRGLARVLRRTLKRLTILLGDIPYNFVLKTTPNPIERPGKPGYWTTLPYDYHWRIAVLPRLTRVAGFEWGTGFYINPMPPESAAGYLRDVDLSG
jgi:UDPglucose--hexose-1-phosphate uridylyltransferase